MGAMVSTKAGHAARRLCCAWMAHDVTFIVNLVAAPCLMRTAAAKRDERRTFTAVSEVTQVCSPAGHRVLAACHLTMVTYAAYMRCSSLRRLRCGECCPLNGFQDFSCDG